MSWGRVFFILVAFLFFSCTVSRPVSQVKEESFKSVKELQREQRESVHIRAMNEGLVLGSFSRGSSFRDYRIGPEDLLEVNVLEDEKLNRVVRVSSQGLISLPLIGVLEVSGLTPFELEQRIRVLLSEKYIRNPNVSVFVREYRSQRVSVVGAVVKPGVFEIFGERTVVDVLAMAGGLREEAGPQLFLIRSSVGDGRGPETLVIDLEQLLIKGDFSLNIPLVHGDVLNVPASGKVFVGGEVRRPGGFHLGGKRITVSQALAMAEGLRPGANPSGAYIFRYSGSGNERISIPVDLRAVQRGEVEDPFLQENDIVIVPRSGVKTFLLEFRETVKGLIGFGFSLGSL